ncbi:alpha/beta hydrolase [Flavobacterium psychrotolerans]|uniref:Alpha-dextran endo-1,6-alpha-glucosidase n=1 Tax=Flavobacterium psychrotolerans TaxID=2169410 RepID=A0A2U1JIW2_9FLAO|nr:alpha/beta hydrolase-fold protein [Flavobacterium psychrotolerans]PWA05082.1 alpha-dextran endo-1,6-alpha-glucosidase [Flavobacterium psychrotolerans]
MKFISLSLTLLVYQFTICQVTINITSIPSNTPANAPIYLAGDINTWNPGDANYLLQSDGLGSWQIIIPEGKGTVNFKFTRGSWPTDEGNASGGFLPNRTFTFTGLPQTLNFTILSWEDISGSNSVSTAASNVQILNPTFFMPQLNKSRKIWLYLPPDYYTSTKTYPVLYMEDGQNLFDNATSFSGEWQIDETLNTLFNQGDYGAIVVGIDNGGSERLNEYSPWINTSYNAGGKGDEYIQFIAETLKPYIDSNFKTKTQPQFNALIGSSMGAFISVYGACEFPDKFEKVGVFSPAFWFALTDLNSYITNNSNIVNNLRLYFVAGQKETTSIVSDINSVESNLIAKGVINSNVFTKIDSYGTHTESYWRGEFKAAYQWLFAQTDLATDNFIKSDFDIKQIGNREVWVKGLLEETCFDLISMTGQSIKNIKLIDGKNQLPEYIASGLYLLTSKKASIKPVKIFIE